jgi:DNA invertase Pin-like site-specific DNA recombinase
MDGMQIGYARVSTADQDLTVQREALLRLGVQDSHIYVDHGMTGTNRARPGLREALAAVRSGDTLVVTKLDRLARSLPDARDIADELTAKGVALSLGGSRYDPTDPIGRLLFNVLGMVAEFERDLISMRTREGMAVARAKGRLKGKQPKLSKAQRKLLFELHDTGAYTQTEEAELFSVSRATVYREIQRRRELFLASCEAHIF